MIEEQRLKELYSLYGRELLIYIFGFVKIKETAEDIFHDAFVRLIRHSRDRAIDETNIRAFLYRIARNLCIDYLRKNRSTREMPLDENIAYNAPRDSEKNIEYEELRNRVSDLIDKKDPVSRSVYIMKMELDMTYGEIAENLGISERTAQRKMKEMLEYLAESLEKYGFTLLLLILLAVFVFKFVIQ
ncbi:MAG TPA: sigma-70 family RNA polymerase sigma factor [Spirochaetota bacterium]|nr:sigma-70 family RNA polymerase sigma factor [Spirochaetota bacterium]HPC39578.1 sigma-70 family RNA polymerase sigma factor [Spirochaetota bacterium]HPL18829.1 sigma-70 family RNA polymerase sigma factor [Spirochaetota bacterium]HQF09473.1 sigma-70 family RNA polymerase sigma factor [Spirochaetota bacterium]HQH98156.1 sigma-70 family RNA polymerase sigma factor [Spirochaetota bacterium]